MDEKIGEKIAHWTYEKVSLKAIVKLQVNINKQRPLGGSQYIDLPAWIKAKKAVINEKNKEVECFKWALHHDEVDTKQTDRVTQYHHWQDMQKELNLVSLQDIKKFEKDNSTQAANVFGIKEVYPLRISDVGEQRERDINLVLIKKVLAGVEPDFGPQLWDPPVLQVREPVH